jgi:hypothetical protein
MPFSLRKKRHCISPKIGHLVLQLDIPSISRLGGSSVKRAFRTIGNAQKFAELGNISGKIAVK